MIFLNSEFFQGTEICESSVHDHESHAGEWPAATKAFRVSSNVKALGTRMDIH